MWTEAVRWSAVSVSVAAAGGAVVAWLAPGGMGRPQPIEVTEGLSARMYRLLAGAFDSPAWVAQSVELFGEACLLILGALWMWSAWRGLRGKQWSTVATSVATALGTVGAFVISESVKLVVDEERPCRAMSAALEPGLCPEPGDWSFPSNHATLAAGLAVGLAVTQRRFAAPATVLAVVAAATRVASGVHYPHDVLAGVVLGACTVGALLAAMKSAEPFVRAGIGRGKPGLVGHHSSGRTVVGPERGQDRTHMSLDRPLHHVQPPRDLPVGQPGTEQGQHFSLAPGERFDPGTGAGPAPGRGPLPGARQMRDNSRRNLR
ncbi:phosphatase PAP2 family protein [Nocardia flavorosea]|nr:phosphatase PAP2 family protein [Nocardia flavorosea]